MNPRPLAGCPINRATCIKLKDQLSSKWDVSSSGWSAFQKQKNNLGSTVQPPRHAHTHTHTQSCVWCKSRTTHPPSFVYNTSHWFCTCLLIEDTLCHSRTVIVPFCSSGLIFPNLHHQVYVLLHTSRGKFGQRQLVDKLLVMTLPKWLSLTVLVSMTGTTIPCGLVPLVVLE